MSQDFTAFNWDPSASTAGKLIFDKGAYVFNISKATPFVNVDRDTKEIKNFGIRITLKCLTEGKFQGKSKNIELYYHSPGALDMNKQFYCAAYGYDYRVMEQEANFNAFAAGKEWNANWVEQIVGNGYTDVVGNNIGANISEPKDVLDKQTKEPTGEKQNNFQWVPIV